MLFSCIFVCTAGLHKLSSVLRYSEGDLVRRTGLASGDVHRVVQVVSAAALSSCHHYTALQLYQNEATLPNLGTGVNIYIPSALTPSCCDDQYKFDIKSPVHTYKCIHTHTHTHTQADSPQDVVRLISFSMVVSWCLVSLR